MKTYKQLTYEPRCQIYALKGIGISQNKMATLLNIHQSTISRELFRNTGKRGILYCRPIRRCLCEALRATIENDSLNATGVPFTISIGLTYSGKDLEEAVSKADKALYQSKESGRNRVSTEF